MGSRAADKLKEIEDLRTGLGEKLDELERRFPVAGLGKKAAAAIAGSSVAGSALAIGLRRLRPGRRKRKKKREQQEIPQVVAPVNINLLPKGAAYLAAAGLAAWAGYKLYESLQRNGGVERFRPKVITQMAESGRQVGN